MHLCYGFSDLAVVVRVNFFDKKFLIYNIHFILTDIKKQIAFEIPLLPKWYCFISSSSVAAKPIIPGLVGATTQIMR